MINRQNESPDYLCGLGIVVETSSPRFVGRHVAELNGQTYQRRKIILATGSQPLRVPRAKLARLYDNQHA